MVDDLCYDVIAVLNEPDEEPTAEILKSDLTWENLKKRLELHIRGRFKRCS